MLASAAWADTLDAKGPGAQNGNVDSGNSGAALPELEKQEAADTKLNQSLEPSSIIPPPKLPPRVSGSHAEHKSMPLGQIHTAGLIKVETLNPIRLEASYTEPISLKQALEYTLDHNLAIGINRQTYQSSIYNFAGALAGYLPNSQTVYGNTHTTIFPHTHTTSDVFSQSVNFPLFQGGRITYGAIGSYDRMKATRQQLGASINDTLLQVYMDYTNCVLQRVLLRIRIKAVEVDQEQLRLNERLYETGVGTKLAVMQARTQLSLDQQSLLLQQEAVRQAGLQLAFDLNLPLSGDYVPMEARATESALFRSDVSIDSLLNQALVHRPELRQYEYLRLAANRNIQVAAAPLYPVAQYTLNSNYQSTSIVTNAITANNTNTAGVGQFGGTFNTLSSAFNLGWTLPNLGMASTANILAGRAIARQAMLQANQVLLNVQQQVRSSYITMRTAHENIDVAAVGVESSTEELHLARIRLEAGVATYLDLLTAQRDYIQTLTNQAQAIIASNQAQAQLLHDTGLISVDTLTKGDNQPIGLLPGFNNKVN